MSSDGAMQEIGCPHDFGVVYQCLFCGAPRHLSTSEHVTERFSREHPGAGHYSWPPPFDEKRRLSLRFRLIRWLQP